MKIMRHGDIRLTMEVYNDDELLDVLPAMRALPRLQLPLMPAVAHEAAPEPTL